MSGFRNIQKWILLGVLFSLSACADTQEGTAVAHVGQARLTKEEVLGRIPTPFLGGISIEEKRQLIEKWVEEELFYQESLDQKLHEESEIVALIGQATRSLLVAKLLERTYAKDSEVLEGEILNYFEEHRQSFERDQSEIRVRHILVTEKDLWTEVWNRLRNGELFEQVAREVSIDVSAESGGDLGYFNEDMVGASFWEACQAAKLGRPTRVTTSNGFHIVEVLDRREAGSERDLVDVRGEIQQRILSERRRMLREKLLEEIKARTEWSVKLEEVD